MREDGGDGEASGALDVHEEGAGCRDEGLEFRKHHGSVYIQICRYNSLPSDRIYTRIP